LLSAQITRRERVTHREFGTELSRERHTVCGVCGGRGGDSCAAPWLMLDFKSHIESEHKSRIESESRIESLAQSSRERGTQYVVCVGGRGGFRVLHHGSRSTSSHA